MPAEPPCLGSGGEAFGLSLASKKPAGTSTKRGGWGNLGTAGIIGISGGASASTYDCNTCNNGTSTSTSADAFGLSSLSLRSEEG